jgi:hypothetical protein
MKIALTSIATVLLACSTSSPSSTRSEPSAAVASAREALLELGRLDADDVRECRAAAQRCAAGDDAASNPFCQRIDRHCDELDAQLARDRAELASCLERAAACEDGAADPSDCAAARASCEPREGEFRERRGRTRECAERAERCLGQGGLGGRSGFGRGRAEPADAGDTDAGVCAPDDADFVGCCRGRHERGDAGFDGPGGFGRGRAGFPGGGFRPDPERDDGDAGASRSGPGAPLRRGR